MVAALGIADLHTSHTCVVLHLETPHPHPLLALLRDLQSGGGDWTVSTGLRLWLRLQLQSQRTSGAKEVSRIFVV